MTDKQPKLTIIEQETTYQPDPARLFNQLCSQRPATLLLESAEINSKKKPEKPVNHRQCLAYQRKRQSSQFRRLDRKWPKFITGFA